MEVVSMMNVQIPATDVRYAHIMPTQFRGLHIPNYIFTIAILVSNFHDCSGHAVDSLPVDVQPVPGVREFNHWIGFEHFFEQDALYGDPQVDEFKGGRNKFGRELQLDSWKVSRCSRAVVDQMEASSRNSC